MSRAWGTVVESPSSIDHNSAVSFISSVLHFFNITDIRPFKSCVLIKNNIQISINRNHIDTEMKRRTKAEAKTDQLVRLI